MQDKTDKIDDIEVDDFDDLDFEDLDTEDDFGDESWDDFDEPEETQDVASSDPEATPADMAPAAPKKKSFVQKNFNLIVIAIALLGGGTFAFLKFGSALTQAPAPAVVDQNIAAQNAPFDSPAPIEELNSDFPPMPAPIGSIAADEAIITNNAPDSSESLTPLPNLSDATDLQPLADLNTTTDNNVELAASDLPLLNDNPLDLPLEEAAPAISDGIDMISEIESEEDIDLSAIPDGDMAAPEIPVQNIEDISLNEPLEIAADIPALDTTAPAMQEAMPPVNDLSGVVEELEANLSKKDKALEEAAMNETKISAELSTANTQIQALQNTVSALESQIQSLKNEATSAPVQEKPEVTASVKKAEPVISAPKTEKPKKQPTTQWVMRSARPGSATISPKNSGDFRQVETGDTVPGIGKIKSIQIENGRWVIQGSAGQVSQ